MREPQHNRLSDANMPNNVEDLKRELIEALEEEIQKIEEEGLGISQYKIVNGKLLKQEEDLFIYLFITDDIIELPEDLPVEIKISADIASGHIVTISGFEVTIALEKNLGEYIPSALLLSSAKFLLEKIKACLEETEEINPNFNYKTVEKTFGLTNQTVTPCPDDFKFHKKCNNPKQIQAIEASLKKEVLFVWGPPGTGKTTTLGGIVHSYLNNCEDLRLLILSHTNVATDKAAENIIDLCLEHEFLEEGKIIRFGNIVEDSKNAVLENDDILLVKVSKIVERKTKEFSEHLQELNLELEKLIIDNEKIQKLLVQSENLAKLLERIDQSKEKLRKKKFEWQEAISGLKTYQHYLRNIKEEIHKAEKTSQLKRIMFGKNLEKMKLKRNKLEIEAEEWRQRVGIIEAEKSILIDEFLKHKRWYCEDYNGLNFIHADENAINWDILLVNVENGESVIVRCLLCNQLLCLNNELGIYRCPKCKYGFEFFQVSGPKNIDWERLESNRENNLSKIEELEPEIAKLTNKINEISDQIILDARVIITTVTQSYLSKLISSKTFDVVIFDEASMIPLPIIFFASGLASQKIVVIGDFKQLPPISISENKYLKTDIFEYSGVKRNVENDIKDDRLVALNEQYRMHPEISQICNSLVYTPQNELIDSEEVKNPNKHKILEKGPYEGEPIVFCDTTCANPWCNSTPSGSVFNLYHSIFILKLVEDAIRNGVLDETIGVITPYKDQAKFLNRMRQKILPDNEVRISTVHKFQGLENEMIIFDTAVSYGKKGGPGYFFSKSEQANRLLNVAISRPKSKLIVVGNGTYLNKRLDTGSMMFRILDHFKLKNKVYESDNLIEKYYEQLKLTKDQFKESIDQKIESKFFSIVDQNDFYDIFIEDLKSINKSEGVVIFSPFIQYGRTSGLMNYFKAVVDKGAKLTIFTEAKYQKQSLFADSVGEAISYLKEIGADIRYKSRLHEKRAFISNRIWWEGSLNILSHSKTTEDMLRFSQKDIIDLAINNFKLSGLLGVGKIKREERDKWRSIIKDALKLEERRCTQCTGRLVIKFSRYGPFLACDSKKCNNTSSIPFKNLRKRIEDANIKCTECDKGYIRVKTSRKGGKFSVFLGCDNYPKCKFIPRL